MYLPQLLVVLTALLASCMGAPTTEKVVAMPVVVWHGLGDSAYSQHMQRFKKALEFEYPDIFVYTVALGPTPITDHAASFHGNVDEQVSRVCESLAAIPQLARGFDAIGFSQGGQFLRAYVERCNAPPVRNLITYGSQHMGITDLPPCREHDVICKKVHEVLSAGVYTDYAQAHSVVAQYYRDTHSVERFDQYLTKNHFLTDINNEGEERNATYKANLERLNKFVMVRFENDTSVVPPSTAWFSSFPEPIEEPDGRHRMGHGCHRKPVPLRRSRIYTEDRIGLRALDRRGALVFESCAGGHMATDYACFKRTLGPYLGAPRHPCPHGRFISQMLRPEKLRAHVLRPELIVPVVLIAVALIGLKRVLRRSRTQGVALPTHTHEALSTAEEPASAPAVAK